MSKQIYLSRHSITKHASEIQINYTKLKGGSRHEFQYYNERLLFFRRYLSNLTTLHHNALTALAVCRSALETTANNEIDHKFYS